MDNSTLILACPTTETFVRASHVVNLIAYYVLGLFYITIGLFGHIVAVLTFYNQFKTLTAYIYQLVYAINAVLVLVTEAVFVFGHEVCASSEGGCLWYKRTYILMWYEAHLSLPVTNTFFTIGVLLALSTTIDRVFALAAPMVYRAKNHKRHQGFAVLMCYLIGVAVNAGDCLMNDVAQSDYNMSADFDSLYTLASNDDYSTSTLATLTWYSRNFILAISVIGLASCNAIILCLYRKRNTKIGNITAGNAAKEAERRANEKTLLLLAVNQSTITFLSAGSLIAYYGGMQFVDNFFACYDMMCSPVLDAMLMLTDMSEFYVAVCVSKQMRREVSKVVPFMKRFVNIEAQQTHATNVTHGVSHK